MRPLAIALAVIVLPILAFGVWDRVERGRLSRAADRIDLSDDALAGFPIPRTDEQIRASHDYGEAERLSATIFRAPSSDLARAIEQLQAVPPREVARDPRFVKLRDLEQLYPRALELLDRATALDARGFADEDRPSFFGNPAIAQVNAVRIARLALSGDAERASAALRATLRLSRVLPPSSFRLRTSQGLELILSRTEPSEPTLAALQQEYARVEQGETVQARLEAARVRLMQMMVPEEFGDPPWMTGRRVSPMEATVKRLTRPSRARALVGELSDFERVFAAVSKPWPDKLDAGRAFMEEARSLPINRRGRSLLRTLVSPVPAGYAVNAAATAVGPTAESLARVRASIAALGIARYRRAHGGALPATLRELVPAYLAAVPGDPFTGAELCYRRDAKTYRVYSAGADRTDGGGSWYVLSDLGSFRRGIPDDVGILVMIR